MDETAMFNNWAEEVERVFCNALSDGQRFLLVVRLLSRCSWLLVLKLFWHMDAICKRDFVCLLPDCAVYKLLSYLDVKSLLTACQVSRRWNDVISGNQQLWRNVCSRTGFLVPAESSAEQLAESSFSKCLYFKNSMLVKRLSGAFPTEATSLMGDCKNITAMYIFEGKLAAVSRDDNTMHLWCCASGDSLAVYSAMHSQMIHDIKFDDKFIVTASSDRTAACWDVTNGTLLKSFVSNRKVFCVDFNTRLDILVTGPGDDIVTIWSFTGGNILRTLEFRLADVDRKPPVNRLIIWGVVDCSYHIWAATGDDGVLVMDYEIECNTTTVLEKKCMLSDCDGFVRYPGMLSPYKGEIRYSGFHVIDSSSFKVWYMDCETSEDFTSLTELSFESADVCGRRLFTRGPTNRVIHFPKCIDIDHLGSGANFDVFLWQRHEKPGWSSRLYIRRNNSETGHFSIDLSKSSTSLYEAEICDSQWLDGICEESVCCRPLVAVYTPCHSENSIGLLKLRP